jgi:hypothetical protein
MWEGFNSEEPSSSIGNVIFHIDTYKVTFYFWIKSYLSFILLTDDFLDIIS